MKKALLVLFVLMLAVCLTSCGDDAEEVGSYELESVSIGGETISFKEFKEIYSLSGEDVPEYSIIFNKNGTGKMTVMGETADMKWDAKAKTITIEGDSINYTYKDKKVTISVDGETMIFVKK